MSDTKVEQADHFSDFGTFQSLTIRSEQMADAVLIMLEKALGGSGEHEAKCLRRKERYDYVDALARAMAVIMMDKVPASYKRHRHWDVREKMQHIEFASHLAGEHRSKKLISYLITRFAEVCSRTLK